uniref:Uncharacterized protein n=1 Tax=Ixodes ricinus TaxID=34613 RepID=A0A6B0TWV0_IXORI
MGRNGLLVRRGGCIAFTLAAARPFLMVPSLRKCRVGITLTLVVVSQVSIGCKLPAKLSQAWQPGACSSVRNLRALVRRSVS